MKKLFLLLVLVGVLGISCSDKEETTPNQHQTPTEQPEDNSGSENESPENDDDQVTNIPNNEIWYTTTDGNKLFPQTTEPTIFGAILVSNTYSVGKGVLTFDDDITLIGDSAFSDCTTLATITIPDSVTTIGEKAFQNCSSLTSITIPDSVTTIGGSAFYDCSSLTSVTIGDGVTTIGDRAFSYCSSLTSVYISDLSAWCKIDFGSSSAYPQYYAKNLYLNNELVTDLVIPSDITEIKSYLFSGCSSLTSITIPDSVTTIEYRAFYDCSSLTSVTIGDSVTTIGNYAFNWCKSLTSVTIGDSVTTIGFRAFEDCSSLTSVYCKAVTPPAAILTTTGSWSAFDYNASDRKIYVPTGSVEAYKSAKYWKSYADAIVGYNF